MRAHICREQEEGRAVSSKQGEMDFDIGCGACQARRAVYARSRRDWLQSHRSGEEGVDLWPIECRARERISSLCSPGRRDDRGRDRVER